MVVRGLAEESQKKGEHDEAVLIFRLLVRRDQVCVPRHCDPSDPLCASVLR